MSGPNPADMALGQLHCAAAGRPTLALLSSAKQAATYQRASPYGQIDDHMRGVQVGCTLLG